jgi:nucleotide-binding universal stress UspA family protein
MIRFERILCPTDFSKFSFRAADYAVTLARQNEGEVHFLHVIPAVVMHPDNYPYIAEPVRIEREVKERALDRLDAFASLSRAENVKTRASVVEGAAVSAILDAADKDGSDLICLGTHGREGFERLVLGSVAEKVLRKAPCPVLTISEPGAEEKIESADFKNILCAVDFATLSLKAVELAFSLAQEAGGKLMLLNVVEWLSEEPGWEAPISVQDYRKEIEAEVARKIQELIPAAAKDWCEVETVVRSGKAYREILDLAAERKADLVVMGVRGRNPLDLMLFGSTAQHVVRHAPCPVLTVGGRSEEEPAA